MAQREKKNREFYVCVQKQKCLDNTNVNVTKALHFASFNKVVFTFLECTL